jgi:hypothetical protein
MKVNGHFCMAYSAALLNCAILTSNGKFEIRDVNIHEAKAVLQGASTVKSYIGHKSTAEIMSALLEIDVACCRDSYTQGVGEVALVFALAHRQAEGVILSKAEIDSIGYSLKLLTKLE